MAATTLVQPFLWTTGVHWFDAIVCHTWHTQLIYWCTVFVSTWNLVLVSTERYMAICMPFSHSNLTPKRMWMAILFLYPLSLLCTSIGFTHYQFDYDNDKCVTEYAIPGQIGIDFSITMPSGVFSSST